VVHDDQFLLCECQHLLVLRDEVGVVGVGLQGFVEGKVAVLSAHVKSGSDPPETLLVCLFAGGGNPPMFCFLGKSLVSNLPGKEECLLVRAVG
jgi:hypothetical protein